MSSMDRREFLQAAAAGASLLAWRRAASAADAPGTVIPPPPDADTPPSKPATPAAKPAAAPGASSAAKPPPNILFILADDVGIGDVHAYSGLQYPMPRLDALAKGGAQFDFCYADPLGGPTRYQLLTGRYPFRTGMTSDSAGASLHPHKSTTLPGLLKSAGYVTAAVGKWDPLPLQPSDFGFDEYLRFHGSGVYYGQNAADHYTVNGQDKPLAKTDYLPDIMHDWLTDFITRHQGQPWYVHYAMSHLAAPLQPTPDSAKGSTTLYADNLAYMDKLVGKAVDALGKLNLRQQTMVLFTGSNGSIGQPMIGQRAIFGNKGTLTEGGSRVPLLVDWPGTTPGGQTRRDLVDFTDFYTTLGAAAGATLPGNGHLDGRNYLPLLQGQAAASRLWIYVEAEGQRYVRDARYKLTSGGQLYDLENGPFVEKLIPPGTGGELVALQRLGLYRVMRALLPKGTNIGPVPPSPTTPRTTRRRGIRGF